MRLTFKLTGLLVAGNCVVLAGYGLLAHQRDLDRFLETVTLTAVSVAVSGLIAFGVGAALIGRPVERLVGRVEAVGDGNLTSRLDLTRTDELGALGAALDQMATALERAQTRAEAEAAERLATLRQLRHAERLATVGRLGAGLAHELGTPLNVVLARAKLVERQAEQPEAVRKHAEVVREQTQKMTRIIRQLLDFARRGAAEKERTDLRSACAQVLELLEPLAQKQSVVLRPPEPGEPAWCYADPGQIEQVVTNLVMNAIHASPAGGAVAVELTARRSRPPFEAGDEPVRALWRLSVVDQGPGVPPEVRERIFEPFFTTKDVGEGTGLGLTVVHGIVAEHDGWIEVGDGDGGRFDVYLPALEAAA